MTTYTWWSAAWRRALKTFCQTAVSLIPVGVMISDVNWLVVVSTSALAAILSLLTSVITTLPEVNDAPEIPDEIASDHGGDVDE